MDQLTGNTINVILSVMEGRGFDFVCKHPIVVEARLENNILESSLSSMCNNPKFSMEFLWETTKQAARRLRTAKVPLRVEFYSITDQEREKIGFVLINLSGAYIVHKEQHSDSCPTAWHKLIMCANIEARAPRPEILLGLRIEDECRNNQHQGRQENMHISLQEDQEQIIRNELSEVNIDVPIVNVGPELMGTDIFSIEIVCSKVHNLDWFRSRNVSAPIDKAHLIYKIFGTSIRSQSNIITESSKTCVAVKSTIQFLYQHLQKNPVMKIQLMSDQNELAFGDVDVSNLIPINNLDVFLQHHGLSGTEVHANQIELTGTPKDIGQLDLENDTSYPYVAIVVRLQYNLPMETTTKDQDACSTEGYFPISNTTCKALQAAGEIYPTGENVTPIVQKVVPPSSSNYRKPASTSHIPSTKFMKTVTSHSESAIKGLSPREVYNRTYALDVSIENILFHKLPAHMNFFFKFYHSKAEILPTCSSDIFVKEVNKMVCLENIKCSFKFVTTAEEISRLLITNPPNISICTNLDNQTIQLATATIDTGRLLVEKKSSTYSLPLIDMPIGEEIGSIFVAMSLEELYLHQNEDTVLRHIVSEGGLRSHDEVAYSVVEELHIWKERQEEIFKEELVAKEKQHMNAMATEFKKKRDALQNRLHRDLLQCQIVIQTLQAAIDENRATTRKQVEMEAELKLRQEELDRKYKTKFQDLREASKRMEDDLQHRMKMIDGEKSELLATNERLQKENKLLKQTIHDQEVDFEICQKGSLSKEQIASLLQETKLLQEKLKEATESKTLFKQQWAHAVREIHKIKCDHQEAIQIQIRDFKEELKSLGFQRFLNEEETELREDQQILQRMQLDVNNELSGYNDYSEKLNEMFPDSSIPDKGITPCDPALSKDEGEPSTELFMMSGGAKLQQLIRERDALLRTGNFSMDHSTVNKLNQEIRKHIINPC